MELTFLGATGTVTGSKYVLAFGNQKVMIDCGLFQGVKELRLRNWKTLPIEPESIDSVILTHAHIDHTGYLPLLYKNGFRGSVYCTQGTKDLCQILLMDSAYLQEEEARYANRHGYSKHHPALPLYTSSDAQGVLTRFQAHPHHSTIQLSKECDFSFLWAGHIIGSSFVRFDCHGKIILFSGDIGRMKDDVMNSPDLIDSVDYLIMESTYGDRLHDKKSGLDVLEKVINETVARNGSILIPSFAVGRAQTLLHLLSVLKRDGRIPNIPIFLDSPMAVSATRVFTQYANEHHLTDQEVKEMSRDVTFIDSVEESKSLEHMDGPLIIVSASGMLEGGRVLHHAKALLPKPENTILFTGYQAVGTRGARILNGEKRIKMLGEQVEIKAQIKEMGGISAHGDLDDMMSWLKSFKKAPKKVFLVHGEEASRKAFRKKIVDELGWTVFLPDYMHTETL